jgi:TP901 family phage tail tape measure protein
VSDRSVVVRLVADTSNYRRGLEQAAARTRELSRHVDGLTSTAHRGLGSLSRAAGGMVALAGAGGLGAVVTSSVKAASEFETRMRQIAVATGAPASSIKGLNDLAIKMGRATVFSAQEAGDAMLELAKGGMNEAQIRAGALASTLTLASAGSLELGEAAAYVVQGLATFGLQAKDSAKVAAALAGAANASTASVQSIGQALSAVGPGAKLAGLSLQQTTGILAMFDKAGLKGSDAGTSLKTMLMSLVPQTDKAENTMRRLGLTFTDAHGRFRDIADIAQQLHDKLGNLSEAEQTNTLKTLFGTDAYRAAAIVMEQGRQGVVNYTRAASDLNAAQDLAKAATSGTQGAIEQMSGAIDTAKLQLGQALAPVVVDLAHKVGDLADTFSTKGVPKLEAFIHGMENGTGPGGDFAHALDSLGDALGGAWRAGRPLLAFIGDHPDLFAEVAKDAVIFAGAMKAIGAVKGLTGIGKGLGAGALGGVVSKASPVPVFVTNPGFGGGSGLPGLPGGGGGTGGGKVPPALLSPGVPAVVLTGAITAVLEAADRRRLDKQLAAELAKLDKAGAGLSVEELQQAIRVAEALAKRDHVDNIGPGKRQVDPKMDADITRQGIRATEIATKLRQEMNNKLIEIDRMSDPRYVRVVEARARNAAQAFTDPMVTGAQRTSRDIVDLISGGMSRIDHLRATPKVDLDDKRAHDKALDLFRQMEHLDHQRPRPIVNLHDLAKAKITALRRQLEWLDGRTVNTTVGVHIRTDNDLPLPTGAGHAVGGYITGPGTSTSDSIPAMLSNGEFVVNAAATKDNLALLHAINTGAFRAAAPAAPAASAPAGRGGFAFDIQNLNVTQLPGEDAGRSVHRSLSDLLFEAGYNG